jgi:hypothetical protein
MTMPATLSPNQRHDHGPTPSPGLARPHARARWSALASDAGGRLLRVAVALVALWLAVAWALAAGTD